MPRSTKVLSVSLPATFLETVEQLAEETEQTKSELIRNASRAYISEENWYRERADKSFEEAKGQPRLTMAQMKKKYNLK